MPISVVEYSSTNIIIGHNPSCFVEKNYGGTNELRRPTKNSKTARKTHPRASQLACGKSILDSTEIDGSDLSKHNGKLPKRHCIHY